MNNENVQVDLFAVVGRLTVEAGLMRDRIAFLEAELVRVQQANMVKLTEE